MSLATRAAVKVGWAATAVADVWGSRSVLVEDDQRNADEGQTPCDECGAELEADYETFDRIDPHEGWRYVQGGDTHTDYGMGRWWLIEYTCHECGHIGFIEDGYP